MCGKRELNENRYFPAAAAELGKVFYSQQTTSIFQFPENNEKTYAFRNQNKTNFMKQQPMQILRIFTSTNYFNYTTLRNTSFNTKLRITFC